MPDFHHLEPGDEVVILNRRHHGKELQTIERLTKTQIVTDGGRRFRRRDGHGVGDQGDWLKVPNEATKNLLRWEAMIKAIQHAIGQGALRQISTHELAEIHRVLVRRLDGGFRRLDVPTRGAG